MRTINKRVLPFLLSLAMVLTSLSVPARAEEGEGEPVDVVIENQTEIAAPDEDVTEAAQPEEPATEAPAPAEPETEAPAPAEPETEAPAPAEPETEAPAPAEPETEAPQLEETAAEAAEPAETGTTEVPEPAEPAAAGPVEPADEETTEAAEPVQKADPEVPTQETAGDTPVVIPAGEGDGDGSGDGDGDGNGGGQDCHGEEGAQIGDYYVSWNFRWSIEGISSSSYEYKSPYSDELDYTYLLYHPQTWDYMLANLLVELNFSGEDQSIPAGAIEIRIPCSTFVGWDGSRADSIVTQMPLAPATNNQSNFNYYIDDNTQEIVIKNFDTISGNRYLSAEVAYKVSPLDVDGGYPDEQAARTAGYPEHSYGVGETTGDYDIDRYCWNNNGKYYWKEYYKNESVHCSITIDPDLDGTANYYDYDNPLKVAMMTRGGGFLYAKRMPDEKSGVYTAWQSTWGPRIDNAEDYIYVIWDVNYGTLTSYQNNQPGGIEIYYDETYPAITFGEGSNQKIIYGEQVGKMLHTIGDGFVGGVPNNRSQSYYAIITPYGGDSSRGYYTNLGTDAVNTTNKNNYHWLFVSKYATKYHKTKTGQINSWDRIYDYQAEHDYISNYLTPHFAVLVKYPLNEILQYAEEYNVDLEHDGIKIYGRYYGKEIWESGYTIDREARGSADLFIVDRSGDGVFTKRHRADNFTSNITKGGQTALLDGTNVDLDNASVDGFMRFPYYMTYNGTAPTRDVITLDENNNEVVTKALYPQRLILQEEQLMLSSAGALHPRGWQPNGEDAAARPIGTGYDGDGNYFLTDDDYCIPRFDIRVFEDYQAEFTAGVWAEAGLLAYQDYKPIFVYVRYKGQTEFVPYCAVVKTSQTGHTVYKCSPTEVDENGDPVIFKNNANIITAQDQHYALPDDVVSIRWEHETSEQVFRIKLNVTVHVILYPTPNVKACVERDVNHVNSDGVEDPVNTYVKNIGSFAVYKGKIGSDAKSAAANWEAEPWISGDNYDGGNGIAEYVIWILDRITNSMSCSKDVFVPEDDDPVQVDAGNNDMEIGYVKLQVRNWVGVSKNIVLPTDVEDPYKTLTGTFYELLPKGTNVREGSVFGVYNETWSSHQYSAKKYPEWVQYKDLGDTVGADGTRYFLDDDDYKVTTKYIEALDQTLIIINYSFADPRINDCPDSTWNGFLAFYFIIENPYHNIRARGTSTTNYFAFENKTEGGRSAVASGSAITAANLENDQDIADAFLALVTDGNENRAGCAFANMRWNNVTVLEASYAKSVCVPETQDGLGQQENYYADGQRVTVGGRYIYRLELTNMPTTRADNIVFYDIFETGVNDANGELAESSAWKGKFVSVDTTALESVPSDGTTSVYCNPKIYYSTTLTDPVDLQHPEFNIQSETFNPTTSTVWSRTCPDDPSTVTAIAIDCREARDGSSFKLTQKGVLTAFVHMTAPLEMVTDDNGEVVKDAAAVNGSVMILRPYNETPGDINPDQARLMSRASLMLRDVDVTLTKVSDPKTGTQDARTIVNADGTGTIVYRLTLRSTMPFDCNDVVVTDPIPEYLTVDKVTVKLNGAAQETDGNSTDGFSYTLADDGRTYTFNIEKQYPTVIETGEDGTETVTDNRDTEIYIYTTVDKLVDANGKQVFLRDYDNTATLVSANGKEVGQETDTMYHRAETVRLDVEKEWDDIDDHFRKRPESITIHLTGTATVGTDEATGDPVTETYTADLTVTPDEQGNWAGSFENLPKYFVKTEDADFETPTEWFEYSWAVTEEPIGGTEQPLYLSEVSDPTQNGSVYKVKIKNTYPTTEAELKVSKELVGRGWRDGDSFRFTLEAEQGTPLPETTEVTVTGPGAVSFGTIYYDTAGTYTYTIKEIDDGLPGLTYDDTVNEVTVTVVQDPDTKALTATVEEGKEVITFTNPYESEGEIVFEAEKILKNKTLEDQQFSFELKDSDGNVLQTVFNDADGKVIFEAIGFTQDDFLQEDGSYAESITRVYTMNEVIPDPKEEWYAYDEGIYTVTVVLTDNGDGTITDEKTWTRDGEEVDAAVFTNSYDEPEWTDKEVIKKWDDDNDYLKKRPKSITVHLLADGKEILTDTITEADGWKKTFVKLRKYAEDDGHEIVYTVTEDKVEGYTITINGLTITNAIINTGDESRTALWTATLGASTLALGTVVLLKRKKEEEEE